MTLHPQLLQDALDQIRASQEAQKLRKLLQQLWVFLSGSRSLFLLSLPAKVDCAPGKDIDMRVF
jgi:hypothetical protein